MVNTGRHGDTALEYKPCRKHCTYSEYSSTDDLNPKLWEPNGSKDKVHVHITSALVGNNAHLDKEVALFDCQLSEHFSYSCITRAKADDTTGCRECQYLDTLPYLEIPLSSRFNSSIDQAVYVRPIISFSRFSNTCSPRLLILSIIISMLLMFRSCTCFECSSTSAVTIATNEYLTSFNETNMAAISGQCLTVTRSLIENLCDKPVKERGPLLRSSRYYTDFCGLPLDNILSYKEKLTLQCARDNGCARVVNRVLSMDKELSKMYCQFSNVVDRIDCKDYFPTKGSCNSCKDAYKRWLCSVYNTFYIQGEPVKPCIEFCDQVTENCPFFRPFGDVVIGEPGFLCKDRKNHDDVTDAVSSAVYGFEGCCYKPCQVFEMSGTGSQGCPELTPNCTFATNITNNSSSMSHKPNYVTSVFLICWILCSLTIGQVYYPFQFINSLT